MPPPDALYPVFDVGSPAVQMVRPCCRCTGRRDIRRVVAQTKPHRQVSFVIGGLMFQVCGACRSRSGLSLREMRWGSHSD